jgi:hypothetical protein
MEGTGGWFLRIHAFKAWYDQNGFDEESCRNNVFVVYGIPGAGKPVIWYEHPYAAVLAS